MAQSPTVVTIEGWIEDFLAAFENPHFRKAGDHLAANERAMLKLLKFFFLGKYADVRPEAPVRPKPKSPRFDFLFGRTAVEVVVRSKQARGSLLCGQNQPEMRKLRKHEGLSVLILIDMAKRRSLYKRHFDDYRAWSPGKGNHILRPINILYFYQTKGGAKSNRFNIHV